jgi:hypothetical protein
MHQCILGMHQAAHPNGLQHRSPNPGSNPDQSINLTPHQASSCGHVHNPVQSATVLAGFYVSMHVVTSTPPSVGATMLQLHQQSPHHQPPSPMNTPQGIWKSEPALPKPPAVGRLASTTATIRLIPLFYSSLSRPFHLSTSTPRV